jgi:hypothetical protein
MINIYKIITCIMLLGILYSCQKSSNNFLSEISISTGKLIPEFSKEITEYSLTSLNSLKEITILVKSEVPSAGIKINGISSNHIKTKIETLDKKHSIVFEVKAENGKVRKYKIKTLPKDFPPVTIKEKNNPADGLIFLTNFSLDPNFKSEYGKYLMMLDNSGKPVFYRKGNIGAADFKLQPDGTFTYFRALTLQLPNIFGEFVQLDSDFNEINTYQTKHGKTDMHDFICLKNGHKLMLGIDIVEKDLTYIGGNPKATTWDYFIEETDKQGQLVFEWKSWNYFKMSDIISAYDLTGDYIEHGANCNSLYIDKDNNILLSSRKLDELTKINRKTGDIIWRMGGIRCVNNEFRFINDKLKGFSHQHSITRLENGNLLLFDNGNHNAEKSGQENIFFIPQSRVVEYQIDEIRKTAKLVWEYKKEGLFVPIMASCQRLENGNTLICWSQDSPCITEVNSQGEITLEIDLPDDFQCYSAYKFKIN